MKVPDPLSLNLYTYTHNNPLYYQDPSGHFVISTTVLVAIGLAAVGAVVGGFIGNYIANKVNAASQDRWKYIAGGAVAGAAVGATVGYLAGTVGATGFQQAHQLVQAQQTAQEATPVIGSKLDYVFGQATGSAHNIKRSTDMLNQLNRIGIHNTEYWRNSMFQKLWNDYYNLIPILQENGRHVRDELLIGPNGMLKMETIWQGGKLITIELFGKADSWFR